MNPTEIREYTDYDAAEILSLYTAAGWTAYTEHPETLRQGFDNSLLVLAAYEDGDLAGIIRVVGDGATIVLIQDLLVFPDKQRRGIGTALLRAVLERYAGVRQTELVTDNTEENISFYQAAGFRELSELGCKGFMKC